MTAFFFCSFPEPGRLSRLLQQRQSANSYLFFRRGQRVRPERFEKRKRILAATRRFGRRAELDARLARRVQGTTCRGAVGEAAKGSRGQRLIVKTAAAAANERHLAGPPALALTATCAEAT